MMKRMLILGVAAVAALALCTSASAGDVKFSIRLGSGYYGHHGHRGHYGHHRGHRYRSRHRYTSHYYVYPSYGSCYSTTYRSYPSSTIYYHTGSYSAPSSTVYVPAETASPRVVYGSAQPTYPSQPISYATPAPQTTTTVRVGGDGWQFLGAGNYREALIVFAGQANDNQQAGAPKIGYALASAGLGKFDQAVWAMRRAIHVDAKGADDVLIDDALRARVNTLINHYVFPAGELNKADAAFMVAAMHWLLDEVDQAGPAIDRAIEAGDGSNAAISLKTMIDRKVRAKTQPAP